MMGVEHIQNIAALDGATVTAISDPEPGSREFALEVARESGIEPVLLFEDHRDLLASECCDAVVIASPNFTHVDIIRDCLESPVHLMIEKPLCTTVEDCQWVVDAVANDPFRVAPYHRVVWMGLEYRYMPATQVLLDELGNNAVGTVKMVSIREHRFPFLPKVGNWNRFNRNTGGTLVEKCCHFFDLMNLLIGDRPVRVMASGSQAVNHLDEIYHGERPDILDNAFVIVEYGGGQRAMLDLCMFAEASADEQEISVVGDIGKLEALVTQGIVRVGRRADGIGAVSERRAETQQVGHVGFHHGSSFLEHCGFSEAIRTQTGAAVTVEDGLWSVAVGVAAHRSIEEGRFVEIEEVFR
jgi:myo-inositol 2-dehydrogenase/D-chiro-inositol 1-dehydrogenase